MTDKQVAQYLIDNRARLIKRAVKNKYWERWFMGAYSAVIHTLFDKTNPNRAERIY